jgi:hypothetical protein
MANLIKRFQAKRRIPQKVYELVDSINCKYKNLVLEGKNNKVKLSKLIQIINTDDEITALNALSYMGSIITLNQTRETPSAGYGINLCFGKQGLFVYDWDDFSNKRKETLASADWLEANKINAEKLKEAIISYTNRKTFVETVADYNKFK